VSYEMQLPITPLGDSCRQQPHFSFFGFLRELDHALGEDAVCTLSTPV
jgi:hypothetical protein